jgi:hypothetical protein
VGFGAKAARLLIDASSLPFAVVLTDRIGIHSQCGYFHAKVGTVHSVQAWLTPHIKLCRPAVKVGEELVKQHSRRTSSFIRRPTPALRVWARPGRCIYNREVGGTLKRHRVPTVCASNARELRTGIRAARSAQRKGAGGVGGDSLQKSRHSLAQSP